MSRVVLRTVFLAVVVAVGLSSSSAWAVDPNPLQNAYWRFEEGTAFQPVTPPNGSVVIDSINGNNMRSFDDGVTHAAPSYTNNVAPQPLQSGLSNSLAMNFVPNRDIYADGKKINNGYILPGGGFTVEAAFFTNNPSRYGAIVGKEGTPGGVTGTGGTGLSTFELKTAADTSHLRVQQYDAAGNLVSVDSALPLVPQQWYYTAVVNDGSQLSLWLDSGAGYELQGSVAVNGALYQGPAVLSDYNNDLKVNGADYVMLRDSGIATPAQYDTWRAEFGKNKYDWLYNWTIGRAQFNGNPGDFFDGVIDEVRLSNTALTPSQFLFAPSPGGGSLSGGNVPETTSIALASVALATTYLRRRQRGCR